MKIHMREVPTEMEGNRRWIAELYDGWATIVLPEVVEPHLGPDVVVDLQEFDQVLESMQALEASENPLAHPHRRGASTPEMLAWLEQERAQHAATKYDDGLAGRDMLIEEMQQDGYGEKWQGFVGNYLKRVELFGIQSPQGRQAMGKAIVTLLHCLETAVAIHGPMPKPGVPSGEIQMV